MQPLVELRDTSVALNGRRVLASITWQIFRGQQWAIIGPNGSGKSTLLRLIRGEVWPEPGRGKRIYYLDGRPQSETAVGIRERVGSVSPELQERYLQQEWRLTTREVVFSGFLNTDYLYQKPSGKQTQDASAIVALLGIGPLLRRNVQQLSTGELRKVLIARALVSAPPLLILDEVCDGLDAQSRLSMLSAIDRIARNGTQILYATHRSDELIPAITHVLELEKGRIVRQQASNSHFGDGLVRRTLLSATAAVRQRTDRSVRVTTPGQNENYRQQAASPAKTNDRLGDVLIDIQNADVFLQRKRVLHRINWQLRANENWAVLGPNGAGKSTFLKLVAGALQPAIGGSVRRFNLTPQDSVWRLRRRIGYVSPELQANYRDSITAEQVVASGFCSSIGLTRQPTVRQKRQARQLLDKFAVESDGRVGQFSYGEFRKLLLLRALVHGPKVLLLDEPFDGLDAEAKEQFRLTLDVIAASGAQLVIVTHHPEELPQCVTHHLRLKGGRVASAEQMVGDDGFEPPTNSV